MNRNAIYAVLVLAGAAAAYWYYNKSKTNTAAQTATQDQTPATAAQQYYTQPPNISVQSDTGNGAGGQVYYNNGQAQPMPYNG